MAQHGSLKKLRTRWTADDDRYLAQTIVTVTAQGGSLRDAYKQAAREMSRSFEGTRTRAQFLRESAQRTTSRPWVDHGIRLVGTPNTGLTLKTPRGRARKARVFNDDWFDAATENAPTITLTIEGVTLSGSPQQLDRLVPALCRAIVRDTQSRS